MSVGGHVGKVKKRKKSSQCTCDVAEPVGYNDHFDHFRHTVIKNMTVCDEPDYLFFNSDLVDPRGIFFYSRSVSDPL